MPDRYASSFPKLSPRGIRVAFLLSRYPAISHTFFLKEILGLRARGIEISVASINVSDRALVDLPEVEAAEAVKTFYIKGSSKAVLLGRLMKIAWNHPSVALRGLKAALQLGGWDIRARAFSLFYLAEALLVGEWMGREKVNHLHVHFGGAVATVGMLTSKAWQIPWSVTLHGPDEFFDQDAFYLRQKIESAKFVICISDFCKSQVLRIAPGVTSSRLEIVRLGVDCDALQPRIDAPGVSQAGSLPDQVGYFSDSAYHVVCTGRMVAAKGHGILIEAVGSLVAAQTPLSCTLIGDGPERSVLEELCRNLGIENQVRFLGALTHAATLAEVATADVFVLASFAEGLPVALMEAMALGVPCISTTIAAIPEMIHDRQNGLLVPPANVEALRDALVSVGSDTKLRRSLARQARLTVESEYNLARNLDQLASVWSQRL